MTNLKRRDRVQAWLRRLDGHLPIRYWAWLASALLFLLATFCWIAFGIGGFWALVGLFGVGLGWRDIRQQRHTVLRNYPIVGHLRYLFEYIRPEIRQYFIEADNEAVPFTRQQRSIVYQRAKGELDVVPFGTDFDVLAAGYEWVNHAMNPTAIGSHDFRISIGVGAGSSCTQPYRASIFNISAMSFGSLSGNAILALNKGAKAGGFAHDTGEGSISAYHREHGGDLIWEVASGYFGCRDEHGSFDPERFEKAAREPQVKMIEIKLSQGAKPGQGGVLPGPKVSAEIAAARGVPVGVDCISPPSHSAFKTPQELLHFVERLRRLSGGKPVGFKLCLGHPWEWFAICKAMLASGIAPDFIVVDGSEGGTGAAPVEFIDHVGVPLQEGLLLVHNTLVGLNLRGRIKIGCAGKVVGAFDIVKMMALGADWCNAARGFMFALGCIQAQTCHTGTCPTGVTTQDELRQKALVVPDKATRVARFHGRTLEALKELTQAAGLQHPNEFRPSHIVRRISKNEVRLLGSLLAFLQPGELLRAIDGEVDWPHNVYRLYWPLASAEGFEATPPAAPNR